MLVFRSRGDSEGVKGRERERDAGDGLKGRCAAKLEQHARARRGGRGRRDSVNSRSPRDRGECFSPLVLKRRGSLFPRMHPPPPLHPPTPRQPPSRGAWGGGQHMVFPFIIDDPIRNLLISAMCNQ